MVSPHEDDPAALVELPERHADHPMNLADAKLVLLAKRRDIGEVLTIDRPEFASYRDRGGRLLVNTLPAHRRPPGRWQASAVNRCDIFRRSEAPPQIRRTYPGKISARGKTADSTYREMGFPVAY